MSQGAVSRFLKPEVLARLGSLELVARTVVDGVLIGLHRSPNFGFSQEFAEYRSYNEGDDLRYVDWNVYARSDKMVVKRFRGETNTAVTFLLDISASMGFGSPVSKLEQASYLAASLAYLTRKQHDALGMVMFDDSIRVHELPSARPDSLTKVLSQLENAKAGNGTRLEEALARLHINSSKRGLLVLISDLYTQPDDFIKAIQPLAHSGQDIAVFQVLDEQELNPDIKNISALRDAESEDLVVVDPVFIKEEYPALIQAHCAAIEQHCLRIGADYMRLSTSDSLDSAVMNYLQFRQRQAR